MHKVLKDSFMTSRGETLEVTKKQLARFVEFHSPAFEPKPGSHKYRYLYIATNQAAKQLYPYIHEFRTEHLKKSANYVYVNKESLAIESSTNRAHTEQGYLLLSFLGFHSMSHSFRVTESKTKLC